MNSARTPKTLCRSRSSRTGCGGHQPRTDFHRFTGLKFHLMERPVVLLVAQGKDPAIVLPELELPKVKLFPYQVNAFAYGENPS